MGHDVGVFNRLCLVGTYAVLRFSERVKGALRRHTLERGRGIFVRAPYVTQAKMQRNAEKITCGPRAGIPGGTQVRFDSPGWLG